MNQKIEISTNLIAWLNEFATAINGWEDWLNSIELAYVAGKFEDLLQLEASGDALQDQLAESRAARSKLIEDARSLGFLGCSVTALARWLGSTVPSSELTKLAKLSQQLLRVQQMSTALWITGFQAAGYTSALLDILATGNAERATYGPCERDAMEGGHIVDAAA